jgi:hypothetical protein
MARLQNNNWLGWSYGGGIMNSDPQLVARGDGILEAIISDTWNVIWRCGFNEGFTNGWRSCMSTGGFLESFAASAVGSEMQIAGRDGSGNLWWYGSGIVPAWASLGPVPTQGGFAGAPR